MDFLLEWDDRSIVNDFDDKGRSTIKLKNGLTEFVDFEVDGILEIKGKNHEGAPVVYSWNGQEYGDWNKTFPDYYLEIT